MKNKKKQNRQNRYRQCISATSGICFLSEKVGRVRRGESVSEVI